MVGRQIIWNKGKKGLYHHSEDIRKRIGEASKKIALEQISKGTRKGLFKKGHKINLGKVKNPPQKLPLSKKKYYPSEEIKRKISLALKGRNIGEKSSNWKGGISQLNKIIRERWEYHQWVSSCMTRDKWTCRTCNNLGGKLQVHHIKPFYIILKENNIKNIDEALNCKELWDINNGITLCLECHKQTDSYLSKSLKNNLKGGSGK